MSFASDRRFFLYSAVFHRSMIEQRFPFCDYEYWTSCTLCLPSGFDRACGERSSCDGCGPGAIPHDKDSLPITDRPARRLAALAANKGKALLNRHARRVFPELSTLHSDYEGWVRTDLRSWSEDLLFGAQTLSAGLFRPEAVRSVWHRLLSGKEPDIIGKLAPIMTLEMLLRQSFDGISSDHVPFAVGV
jgi:hypothetical protein